MSTVIKDSPETALRAAIFHYFQWSSSTCTTAAAVHTAHPPGTDENENDKEKLNTKNDPPSPTKKGSKVLAALLEEFPELASFKAPPDNTVPELKVRFEGHPFEVSRRMYLEDQIAILQQQMKMPNPPFAAAAAAATPPSPPAIRQPEGDAGTNAAGSKRKENPPSSEEAHSTTSATKLKDPPQITNTNPKRQKLTQESPATSVAVVAESATPVQKQPATPSPASAEAAAAGGKSASEVKGGSYSWEERYEQLVDFSKKYGHTRISRILNPGLNSWMTEQRALHKLDPTSLKPERVAKLNEINFDWVVQVKPKPWKERFEELKEFQREHGHTRVPRNYQHNTALGEWVHRQRTNYRKKNPFLVESDHLSKLEAIGFEFILVPGQTKSWDERFEQLVEFQSTHGHTNVPRPKKESLSEEEKNNGGLARAKRHNQKDEFTFAKWVRLQKSAYRKYKNGDSGELTSPRFRKLEDIGFGNDDATAPKVEDMVGFGNNKKDDDESASKLLDVIGFSNNDESASKLEDVIASNLEDIVAFGNDESLPAPQKQKSGIGHHLRDDKKWNHRMEELVEYKKLHGHCNVPSRCPEHLPLALWVKAQRKYYQHWKAGKRSSLTVDRRQALESIGFIWVIRPRMRKEKQETTNENSCEIKKV